MADNLRRAIQDLTLGAEDEPVPLSATVCNEARRANQFSLMVRPIIPRKQNIRALTTALPRMWGLSGIISGRIVERRKYERLRGFCEICGMITHDTGECDQEDEEQQDGNEVNMAMEVQQDPVVAADGNVIQNNSPQMDNVVLEENFWHNAPIDEVHEEFERRMGVVRTERKRKFVDNLMREMEVTSPDEDEDHATLEWEERRYSDVNVFQYGSFL
ncbi:unnamed protein product, partial [Brassica rapa subsp. trilocularis]